MKTRAFDPIENRWRTDYVVTPDGEISMMTAGKDFFIDQSINLIRQPDWKLSRFTGLCDKYKNEIYEYHVVKITALSNDHHQMGAWEIRTVRYFMGNPCVCWKSQDTGPALYPLIVDHDIEILGNVYENPELLEEVK